jgi:hypothetical protein
MQRPRSMYGLKLKAEPVTVNCMRHDFDGIYTASRHCSCLHIYFQSGHLSYFSSHPQFSSIAPATLINDFRPLHHGSPTLHRRSRRLHRPPPRSRNVRCTRRHCIGCRPTSSERQHHCTPRYGFDRREESAAREFCTIAFTADRAAEQRQGRDVLRFYSIASSITRFGEGTTPDAIGVATKILSSERTSHHRR